MSTLKVLAALAVTSSALVATAQTSLASAPARPQASILHSDAKSQKVAMCRQYCVFWKNGSCMQWTTSCD